MSRLRYCPRCAGRLVWRSFGRERHPHPQCERCGFVLWQNPKPCVGAVVVRRTRDRDRQVWRPLAELPPGLRERLPELRGMLTGPMPASLGGLRAEHEALPHDVVRRVRRRRPGQVEVLLVRRAIEPRRGMWDLPGGFLDPFEHPEEGIQREAREELGVEIELLALLGLFVDTYGDDEPTVTIHYAASITGGEPTPADDVDDVRWFPLHALPADLAFQNVGEALTALKELIEQGELAV